MAIWPFGRKGKRHTIQADADAHAHGDVVMAQDSRHSFDAGTLGRKPSRKQSKRLKNRYSQPADEFPSNMHQPTPYSSSGFQTERNRPGKAHTFHASSNANMEQQLLSRNPSLRKPSRNNEGRATLKKRLSKRKAYEIAREREIRMMASMPMDIPRRVTSPLPGDPMHIDHQRANSAQSRRIDRHRSDISLSIHESSTSSVTDFSDTYTFKVNGFAAWTPRPIIRYVEAPRATYSGNQKSPEPADRRTKSPTLEISNEDLRSKKRIDGLADDLDAGALRELMERDRRRRERKAVEDQEKLVRKLQRNAQKVPKPQEPPVAQAHETLDNERGRSFPQAQSESQPTTQETEAFLSGENQGSWLREPSRDPGRDGRETPESVHVIGNIDDRSIRERRAAKRLSFGPSQDMAMSRSTLSPSLSPSRHGVHSPDSSQLYGMTRDSISDISRNVGSERRLSDHSSGHVNPITSIFRRGSSRLKRSYRERFPDRSPPPRNNVSHESFFKVHTQTSPPAPYVPPKVLLGSSSFKRSQSKFTEHFGEEPLSPPDSRLQSPELPEDEPQTEDQVPDLHSESYYPIPGSVADGQSRHQSWTGDGLDDPENLPLSQSLASVDSEGSWMSGQFLRRISQRQASSARQSVTSSRHRTEEGLEKSKDDEHSGDAQFVAFGAYPGEEYNNTADDQDKYLVVSPQPGPQAETWHEDVARRPVLVNPTLRPKSIEGLLNNVRTLSTISAEDEFSPIEEHSAEILFPTDDDTAINTPPHR
ncbi:uncharacterized protein DSM5745_10003 [Aspergillus mulundensis]|uniref:Uncharacterized protein n=1 Tax=Aspergillus mulundensis TaxID=1810919 RepID=A0A3D8QM70_9EURO|nr:Uncharacterized protein DSM5745_10003 [Aspergillus mulundensis]RDW62892.1 Uncharacterized protein DSM5745_10003 [Aspergillus mulundensis]